MHVPSAGECFSSTPARLNNMPALPATPLNQTTGKPAQHFTGLRPTSQAPWRTPTPPPDDPEPAEQPPPSAPAAEQPRRPAISDHADRLVPTPTVVAARIRDSGSSKSLRDQSPGVESLGPVTSHNLPDKSIRNSDSGSLNPGGIRRPRRTSDPAAFVSRARERGQRGSASSRSHQSSLQGTRAAQPHAASRHSMSSNMSRDRPSADSGRLDHSGRLADGRPAQGRRAVCGEIAKGGDLGVFHENVRLSNPGVAAAEDPQRGQTRASAPARTAPCTPDAPQRTAARAAAAGSARRGTMAAGGAPGCGYRSGWYNKHSTPLRPRPSQGAASGHSTPLQPCASSARTSATPASVRSGDSAPVTPVRAGLVRTTVEKFRHGMPGCGAAGSSGASASGHASKAARCPGTPGAPLSGDSDAVPAPPVGRSRVAQTVSKFTSRMQCTGSDGASPRFLASLCSERPMIY